MSTLAPSKAPTSARPVVHRLHGWRLLPIYLLLVLGIAALLLPFWLPLGTDDPVEPGLYPWIVLFCLLFFDLCLYFFLATKNTRIVTSPAGIEYYTLGMSVRAPWSSVTGFDKVRSGYEMVDSLMLGDDAAVSGYTRGLLAA